MLIIFLAGLFVTAVLPASFGVSVHFDKSDMIGALMTFLILTGIYLKIGARILRAERIALRLGNISAFVEKQALLIFVILLVMIITWFGLVLFIDPYIWRYNHGDGAIVTQVLHNIVNGVGLETSVGRGHFNDYNPYYYISTFSMVRYWLPFLLLSPLYSLYPYPPMHVFSVIIVVLCLGGVGIYVCLRQMRGSRALALLGAILYCLLPQVEFPLFYKGALDNVGFAVLPYVFAALFARKWIWYYICVFLLASISDPYAYLVLFIGLSVFLFFKHRTQGVVAFLIGIIMIVFDNMVFHRTLCGTWPNNMPVPGMFTNYVLNADFKQVALAVISNTTYVFILLLTLSFLPILGIREKGKWNMHIMGMCFIALGGWTLMAFRSTGWEFHRSSMIIVPVYLSAFSDSGNREISLWGANYKLPLRVIFISGVISMSLWCTWYYPWTGLNHAERGHTFIDLIKQRSDQKEYGRLLLKIDQYVPKNASVATNIDSNIQAFLSNRQSSWFIGSEPEGVEYYIIRPEDSSGWNLPWRKTLAKIQAGKDYKLLYEGDRLFIYMNINPKPIPHPENTKIWNLLNVFKECDK